MTCCAAWLGFGCGQPSGPKTTITPYKKRSCTDMPCLGAFVFGVIIVGIVSWVPAFKEGNWEIDRPLDLVYPHDYQRHKCGHGDFANKPVAYWPFAVDHIPKNRDFKLCAANCSVTEVTATMSEVVGTSLFPRTYKSKAKFGYCLPDLDQCVNATSNACDKLIAPELKAKLKQVTSSNFEDVCTAKWMIVGSILLAVLVSFAFIFLMKIFIAPLVYGTIICIVCALFAIFYCLWKHSQTLPVKNTPRCVQC